MLSVKQIIVRIIGIVAFVELLIMILFATVMTELSPAIESIADTITLSLIITPLIYWLVINPYVTANKKLIERINDMAHRDNLTQLWNHRALHDHLIRFFSYSSRHAVFGALLFIDIDNFKAINDQFGHDHGDAVLIGTAKRLVDLIRKEDFACRLGGDEFVVLLSFLDTTESTAKQKALQTAQRIIDVMSAPIVFQQHELIVGVSIGVCLITPHSESPEDVLKRADLAMYHAKQSLQKNKIVIFDDLNQTL